MRHLLHTSLQVRADTVTLLLEGEADMASAEQLAERLAFAVNSARRVVVDARALAFIDAHCVQEIERAARRAADRGGSLEMCNATPLVQRVVEIVGG